MTMFIERLSPDKIISTEIISTLRGAGKSDAEIRKFVREVLALLFRTLHGDAAESSTSERNE